MTALEIRSFLIFFLVFGRREADRQARLGE